MKIHYLKCYLLMNLHKNSSNIEFNKFNINNDRNYGIISLNTTNILNSIFIIKNNTICY